MHYYFTFPSAIKKFFLTIIISAGILVGLTINTANACGGQCFDVPSCPFNEQQGRIIIEFSTDKKIISSKGLTEATSGPISTNISAGTYKVTLFSYDGYAGRVDVTQPHESWYALLKHGSTTIAQSAPIDDLEDKVAKATKTQVVNENLVLSQDVNSVSAVHAFYPDTSSANSVYAVCAAFDANDNDENLPPVITLIGNATTTITVGTTFTDPGATAQDQEDGDITSHIVVGGDTVSTSTPGTYVITYNITDSDGAAAPEVKRTVIVNPVDTGGRGMSVPPQTTPVAGGGPIWPISPPEIVGATTQQPTTTLSVIPVTVAAPVQCIYLLEYLKMGAKNNPVEVIKLQSFLKNMQGFKDLKITGFFDQQTFDAVSAFQAKYKTDILVPWGHDAPTGYVYILTKKKINELYCQRAFPLTSDQQREIAEFRALIESLRQRGITVPVPGEIGKVETVSTSTLAGVDLSQLSFLSEVSKEEKAKEEKKEGFLPAALAFLQLSLDRFIHPVPIALAIAVLTYLTFLLWKRYKKTSKHERILLFPSQ